MGAKNQISSTLRNYSTYKKVMKNINQQYAGKAQNAIEGAAAAAENEFNARQAAVQANPEFQSKVKQAKKATFNSVVTKVQTELKKQLQNIPNAEAKTQLRKQGLGNKNIVNQAKAQIPAVEAQGALLQQQINEAIGNL